MNREVLQGALAYLQRGCRRAATVEAVRQMHAGLQSRLGCPMTVEEALVCWAYFSGALYGQRWVAVDDGFLTLCAAMLHAAARGEEPWGRPQALQTRGAGAGIQDGTRSSAGG